MFRALFDKHVRQARALFVAALALDLAAILLTAIFVHRGTIMPMSGRPLIAGDAFANDLPVLVLAIVTLGSLLMAVQIFTTDRATGTESFLLERPVSTGAVWTSRFVASLACGLALDGFAFGFWAALSPMLVSVPADTLYMHALPSLAIGAGLAVLLCGSASFAAACGANSISAFLMALIVPIGAGAVAGYFSITFSLAGSAASYVAVGLLIGIGAPLASYAMLGRGEPLGRGRFKRGIVVSCATVVLCASTLLATSAVIAHRFVFDDVMTRPSRDAFLAVRERGSARLVDAKTGRIRARFDAPVLEAAWNASGTRFALLTTAGFAGTVASEARVEVHDASGSLLGTPVALGGAEGDLAWVGDTLLASTRDGAAWCVIDPVAGTRIGVPGARDGWLWSAGGPWFALQDRTAWTVQPYRFEHGRFVRVGETVEGISNHGVAMHGSVLALWRGEANILRDLDSGTEIGLPGADRVLGWLADGRPLWTRRDVSRTCVVAGLPDATEELTCGEKPPIVSVSPDGRYVYTETLSSGVGTKVERHPGFWSVATNRWTPLARPMMILFGTWAGPHTMVDDHARLVDLEHPATAVSIE